MFPNSLSKECFSFVSRQCDSAASFQQRQEKFVNLKVDNRTGIATLELNRPPVNSLNTALLKDISDALDEVTKNHSKGLILTSVCIVITGYIAQENAQKIHLSTGINESFFSWS